ncbi:hypothetical protein [Thermococcus sp. JCM 11816]
MDWTGGRSITGWWLKAPREKRGGLEKIVGWSGTWGDFETST